VIKWVIDNAARIFTLIEAVVNGAAQILAGNVSGVANLVERALGLLLVPVIDFLADYLGLGGIPDAIKKVIMGLQSKVEQILDKVIGFIVEKAKALWQTLKGKGKDDKKDDPNAKGAKDDGEVGKHVQFSDGHEGHTLWVDTAGTHPVVMLASTPRPMADHLVSMRTRRDKIAATNTDIHQQTDGLFTTVEGLSKTVEQKALAAKALPVDSQPRVTADKECEAAEDGLRTPLTELLKLLGVDVPTEIKPPVEVNFSWHTALDPPPTPTAADQAAGFTRQNFLAQLKGQEVGLNKLTVGEWQKNRERYTDRANEPGSKSGRDPIAAQLQETFREQQAIVLISVLGRPASTPRPPGLAPASDRFVTATFSQATPDEQAKGIPRANAETLVDRWLSTQAALHDPDQIAGGYPNGLTDLGSRRINSSLGSQWGNTCVAKLDDGVHKALHDIPSPLWIGVGMRVTLAVS
jgi:hypothetical protein